MCWAEKSILIIAALFGFVCLLFAGMSGDGIDRGALFELWVMFGLKILLPLWFLLRVIDLAIGGPTRRKGVIVYHPR